MSDVTNYDGRLEAMANYCEAMYNNIAKVNNAYYDVTSNEYSMSLPNKFFDLRQIKVIGGKTIVWNQLFWDPTFTDSSKWSVTPVATYSSFDVADNVGTITMTSSYTGWLGLPTNPQAESVLNHKYLFALDVKGTENTSVRFVAGDVFSNNFSVEGSWQHIAVIVNCTNNTYPRLLLQWIGDKAADDYLSAKNYCVYDLTLMFGAGSEPTTAAAFESMFPAVYEHNAGTLLSAGLTAVVSKDSNDAVLETFPIPEDITSMEGYGWSCPGANNYIDFEAKQFVQAVGSRAYEAGDESDATVITDGTNTHFELDEPLAFDVELPDETITKAEAGGLLIFENQHGDDYRIPVPVDLEYIGVA